MRFSHFSRGFLLAVYFEILVGFEAMEEEVDFVDAFIDMPMTAIPRFIVYCFFDFVEPFFRACVHGALVDAGEEGFNGFVFERAGVGQNHIKSLFFYLLLNILLDFL